MSRALNIWMLHNYETSLARSGDDDDIVDITGIENEVNTEINIFNSGGAPAGVAAGGAGIVALAPVPAAGASAFVTAIPVVGQVVAVVAAVVAVGTVFHNIDKNAQYKRIIFKTKAILREQQDILDADNVEHQNQIKIFSTEIAFREAQVARTATMNTIVLISLGVTGMLFVYGIARLKKKS